MKTDITLKQALDRDRSQSRCGLTKQLIGCFGRVPNWGRLTRANLRKFREFLLDNVCQSTASVYAATLRGLIGKWCDEPADTTNERLC